MAYAFTPSFECSNPDFVVSSIVDKTSFNVSRLALTEHSQVFGDMFACCDDFTQKVEQSLELDEPASVLDGLLRLLHEPPSLPEASGAFNDADSDSDEAFMLPQTFNSSTVIPLPLLPLLYSLVDKYGLSKPIERSLDMHLLLHIPAEALRVYGFAMLLGKKGIASTASEHILPLSVYSTEDVQAIPTVTAFHHLANLQDVRMKAFRTLLLKEELFPHDYGACPHHNAEAKLHWEKRKFFAIGRLQCNTDIAREMRPVEEALQGCAMCHKACTAAIKMLDYKFKRVPKRINQIL